MNKKNFTEALFIASMLVIIAVALILGVWNKGELRESSPMVTQGYISTPYKLMQPTMRSTKTPSRVVDTPAASDKYENA